MFTLPFVAILTLLGLTQLASATLGQCPTDLACCNSGSNGRRSLLPRTECPVNSKKCCETTRKVIHVSSETNTVQCGKSVEATAPLTIEIKPCPRDTASKCLHVHYGANTDGINYREVHLGLYSTQLTAFIPPGKLSANSYCSLTNGGTTADCWVPFSFITSKLGSTDVCDKTLWAVAHVSYPNKGYVNGNTCYGPSTPVPGKNWAMQFPIKFTCSDKCVQNCCCSVAEPPPTQNCPLGTAFGYQNADESVTLNTQSGNGCNRWGWYQTPTLAELQAGISGTLYVGAGGNDISNAINVGSWTATASPTGGVTVTYSLAAGFFVTEAHIDLDCLPIDTCAPGQYTFNSGGLPNLPVYSNPTPIPYPTCSGGSVAYLILHAAVTQATTATECPPPQAN